MHVDEAGRDHLAGGIDDPIGLAAEPRPDRGDALALDGDVGRPGRAAAAVDHGATANEERPGHGSQASLMTTVFIRSPCLIRSTCSMPEVTRPNTV